MPGRSRFVSLARTIALLAVCTTTACGDSLTDMVSQTMDACIASRNPLFAAGRGGEALDTPLPPEAAALAERLAYTRASKMFQEIAKEAGDQVTLVCALDGAALWKTAEARKFVARYTEHPDAAVAEAARRLSQPPTGR
jgi:hypothetical protein